ncbi:sensor histidine kinase [Rhodocaloribacter sp.]
MKTFCRSPLFRRLAATLALAVWTGGLCAHAQPATPQPEIMSARVYPDSVLHLTYRLGDEQSSMNIPLSMMAGIVSQLIAFERPPEAPPPSDDAPPRVPVAERARINAFTSPETGYHYEVSMFADSLIQIRYDTGAEKYTLRFPPDLIALEHIFRHYQAFTGETRESADELFIDWSDLSFWFRTEQSGNLLPFAGALLLLVIGVPVYLFRKKFRHVKQERDELFASRQRMMEAREAERTHLAAELHDGPVQELQRVLRAYLLPLARTLPEETTRQSLDEAREALQHIAGELRNLCTELRPPVLVHFGLDKAIRSYVRLFEERHPGVAVALDLDAENKTLPMRVRLALFRICQEALNNVSKHARARHVHIRFALDDETIRLIIRDDGRGFTPPKRWIDLEREGHLGLSGLAQRAEAIGGTLAVASAPGEGTALQVVAPRAAPVPAA